MPRTEIVTRACPKCATKIRIPVIYVSGMPDESDDQRWSLGRVRGCPNRCELTDKEIENLV